MQKYDRDYEDVIHNLDGKDEFNMMANCVRSLKEQDNVEFIVIRLNSRVPRKVRIEVEVIVTEESEETQRIIREALNVYERIFENTQYSYSILVRTVKSILDADDYSKFTFRVNLTDFSSVVLFDRRGFFMSMRDEIFGKVSPSRNIDAYHSLGVLDAEKEAPMIFGLKQE